MIYFDKDKKAYGYLIENYIASIDDKTWAEFSQDEDSWDIIGNKFVDLRNSEEYQKKQEKKKRLEKDNLYLTRADVERAIYKVKGMDFDDIVELIKDNSAIDMKALKIELKANNFYRGNPYISQIGSILGFSEVQMDEFFETGDYTKLISQQE